MTHFLQRTALIALATGALGACTTDEALKPSYPTRLPDTAPPPAAPPPAAAPAPASAGPAETPLTAAPAAPVEEHALAPLAPAQPPPPPAPPHAQAPQKGPIATYREVTTRSVTGKVIEVEGRPVNYKVRRGDTLEGIADALDTTVAQLREDNDLKRRAKIHPGQVLQGPSTRGHAYVAGSGDTLYSIAKRFSVTAEALRDENGLGRNATLHAGQKIRLPQAYRDRGPLVTSSRVLVTSNAEAAPGAEASAPDEEAPAAAPPPERPHGQFAAPATQPIYRTVTTRSVTGKVVEVEGRAVSYKVKKGDNLEKIARKLDTTVAQLREDNDIGKREAIQPGDTLQGPRTTAHAYVAGPGDTLYSIARRFGVTADDLRDENDLGHNASLRAGQRIRLPEGYRDHGPLTSTTRVPVSPPPAPPAYTPPPYTPPPYTPPAYTPPAPPPASSVTPATPPASAPRPAYTPPPSAARPYTPPPAPPRTYTPPPVTSYPGPVAAPTAAPSPGDAQISELGRGRFVWPLQGPIVSDFGPKAAGQRNDGVNIGAQVGASVRAAAGGSVVYAGDQVPGFGNLVLIKHADGWVTAYGHLSRVLVKMQQTVTQGQEIGLAGATGGVAEPQLHFEIRYAPTPLERAKPIDPKLVLPR